MRDGLTIGIAGITGSGKTSWVRQHLKDESRLILIDVRGEHNWLPLWVAEENKSDDLEDALAAVSIANRSDAEVRFRFLLPADRDQVWVEFLGKLAYHIGNVTFILEEADIYSNANWDNPGVRCLHNYSRSQGVTFIYLTRNLPAISRRLTSNTKAWVLFRQSEPRYLDQLEARFDEEIVEIVAGLDDLEYVQVFSDHTWEKGIVTL